MWQVCIIPISWHPSLLETSPAAELVLNLEGMHSIDLWPPEKQVMTTPVMHVGLEV